MMGGEIGVEDNSAGGSTFWFSVPLPIASPAQATPTQRAVDSICPRSSCVLLVEDIEINQELARSVIEAAGHKVHVVSDGMEAIKGGPGSRI